MYDECLTKRRCLQRACENCGNLQGFQIDETSGMNDLQLPDYIDEKSRLLIQSRLDLGAPSSAYAVWCEAVDKKDIGEEEIIVGNQQLLSRIDSISAQSFYKAQLAALDNCPNVKCGNCGHLFCLKCTKQAHPDSCISTLSTAEISDRLRPCPRCYCWIEREVEGCNEMECEVCGKRFCWECLQPWSRSCGIYQCLHPLQVINTTTTTNNNNISNSNNDSMQSGNKHTSGKERRPELGWELHDKIKRRPG